MRRSMFTLGALLVVAVAACGGSDGGGGSKGGTSTGGGGGGTNTGGGADSGGGGGGGQEQCGMQTCRAGQYCRDATLSICENGCLNNQNCASNQSCDIPPGTSVGTCANNTAKADLGQPCTVDAGCQSGTCLIGSGATSGICSQTCSSVTDCPGGFTAWKDCGSFPGRGGTFCLPN